MSVSKGLDRSYIISAGETPIVIQSQGLQTTYLYPNVSLSTDNIVLGGVGDSSVVEVFYTLGSTGFDVDIIELDLVCDSDGTIICDSSGAPLNTGFQTRNTSNFYSVDIGSEQAVGPSRVKRELTITQTVVSAEGFEDNRLRINFDDYMAQAEITITQTAPPALTLVSLTGGGVTGTATNLNTSSSNRNQITPSSSEGTAVLTVTGEVGATYTLGENGDIITGLDKSTVFTIPSGGSRTHNITIAPAGDNSRNGGLFATHSVTGTKLQLYVTQPADNVPVLSITNQNLTDPITGEIVTGTINIASADPGPLVLTITNSSTGMSDVHPINIASDGTGSDTFSLAEGTATYTFTAVDSGGRTGILTLEVTFTDLSLSGDLRSVDWNTDSQTLVWTLNGLSLTQRNRLSASNFTVTQFSPSSPSRGTLDTPTYLAVTGTFSATLTDIPPFNSLTGTETTTWRGTLSVGSNSVLQNVLIDKSSRPENPVTFPNGNPTILDTATSVSFLVRYDSLTPNIALTDASSTDDDIWTLTELMNASIGGATDPGVSIDVNNVGTYLRQSLVTISGGDTNTSVSTLMDLIRVTSSA